MSKFAKTLSLWMLLCAWASAQTSGTISGYTKDPTGSFVPNVKVTVTNERTGAMRSATSDDSGFYQVLALVSGVYTIEAEAPGFKKFRNTGVVLTVDENVRADVALESRPGDRIDRGHGAGSPDRHALLADLGHDRRPAHRGSSAQRPERLPAGDHAARAS